MAASATVPLALPLLGGVAGAALLVVGVAAVELLLLPLLLLPQAVRSRLVATAKLTATTRNGPRRRARRLLASRRLISLI
jgi:hypothetical protein